VSFGSGLPIFLISLCLSFSINGCTVDVVCS
jgi:hypothetical protein